MQTETFFVLIFSRAERFYAMDMKREYLHFLATRPLGLHRRQNKMYLQYPVSTLLCNMLIKIHLNNVLLKYNTTKYNTTQCNTTISSDINSLSKIVNRWCWSLLVKTHGNTYYTWNTTISSDSNNLSKIVNRWCWSLLVKTHGNT